MNSREHVLSGMYTKNNRFGARAAVKMPVPNIVRGKVEVKGINAAVGSLVVRVYDVVNRPDRTEALRLPLGSTITQEGIFEICYDDEQFSAERPDQSRPDLLVSVSAPESDADGANRANGASAPLFESAIRKSAAREEWFLIQVDLSKLTSRSLLIPAAIGAVVSEPAAAGSMAEVERDRQEKFREEITAVRRKAVTLARDLENEMEKDLRNRVLQHLTGVTPQMPQWKRFVAPGEDVRKVEKEHQKQAIQETITPITREIGTFTYLVLSEQEREELGDPPDPVKIEQRLRKLNPTSTLLRENPMALACLKRREENPIDPPPDLAPTPELPGGSTTASNADAKVGELIEGIRPPEDLVLGGQPDQGTVSDNINALSLSKGPADVPAFYDFHNLQIAFDHVWEDARAEGYIERAKVMYRTASDMGGDPKGALQITRDPLRALSREVNLVQQAQTRFAELPMSSSVAQPVAMLYRRPMDSPNGGLDGMGGGMYDPMPPTPPPPTPPTPPIPPRPDVIWWPGPYSDVEPATKGYPFTVFAANSINFGLLVTYRQCWEPLNYQVGRLVGTRTLAPKETITVTTRQVVKTTFNRKQIEASQEARQSDSSDTQRDEAEIVSRAQTKTNFALTTQGGYDLGPLGEGSATTAFGRDSDSHSQETKRAMREAARKESQSYRNERRLELESGTTTEDETTEKREITNPNDELALTYIFYELQRRYRVSERLHRAIPVIMVAQRVPRPEEITEEWVRRYDWIIRRFLPDDSYRAALTYLGTRATGDRIVLDELQRHMTSLRAVVDRLNVEIGIVRNEAAAQMAALQGYVERKAAIEENEDNDGMFGNAWEWVAGADEESRDAIRVLEEAARERYEKAVRDEKDLRVRMEREATALQVATESYTKAYAEYSNQRMQVNRLIRHIIDYILHYMQGIWSYEHPDQQFFRHHNLMAPRLKPLTRTYTLTPLDEWPIGTVPQPGKQCYEVTFTTEVDGDLDDPDKYATLAEMADLDKPLGFKGNYIIYPLKKSNALTDFMLTPYLDAELGLRDPDGLGNWTLQEFSDYVECLRKSLSEEEFAEIEPELRRHYQELLADPLRDGEDIVVPTKSLYMQMLVDTGKALETFKEAHRLIDVMKVKAEVRSAELDNLRRAKLVLTDQLEDPNIEAVKNVYYRGETPPHDGDE